jgi:hypothetical protein
MGRSITLVTVIAALAGCSHKKADGLAPASDWNADRAEVVPQGTGPVPSPHVPHVAVGGGDPNDPHAGVDMGGAGGAGGGGEDPHAGVDMGGGAATGNPHAGVDMTGAGGANPHGDMDMAMQKMAPDPDRPIDPTHHIRGVIKLDPKAKAHMKAGTALFVFAKLPDASGQPVGPPLAVQKLAWGGSNELAFELSERNAMMAGTELTGEVIVTAHYDQDGDAKTKDPGDVLGQMRVKIPADAVNLMLDTVVP